MMEALAQMTEYELLIRKISLCLTYSEGKISSESIAKYKGSIQDENNRYRFL